MCHGFKSSTVKHHKDLRFEPSQLAVLWSEQQPSMNPTRPAFHRKLAGEEEQTSKQIMNTESINRAHCALVAPLSLTENIIVSRAVIQSCYLFCYEPINGTTETVVMRLWLRQRSESEEDDGSRRGQMTRY